MPSMKLRVVAGLAFGVVLAGCSGAEKPAASVAGQTVTVTASPATVSVLPAQNPNDPISISDDEAEGKEVVLTKAEQARCYFPADLLKRVTLDRPAPGVRIVVRNAQAWKVGGVTFVGVVSDTNSGTWVVEDDGSIFALDSGAAAMTAYPLISIGEHDRVDPDDRGRDMARGCILAGGNS